MSAPKGQVWVCPACGRRNKVRDMLSDVSCALAAVLCLESSLVFDEAGRVVAATAVGKVDTVTITMGVSQ